VFVANYNELAHNYSVSNSFGTWIDDAFLVDSIGESECGAAHSVLKTSIYHSQLAHPVGV
jgi:hypothetical protein